VKRMDFPSSNNQSGGKAQSESDFDDDDDLSVGSEFENERNVEQPAAS
jgi:hypothetical protein